MTNAIDSWSFLGYVFKYPFHLLHLYLFPKTVERSLSLSLSPLYPPTYLSFSVSSILIQRLLLKSVERYTLISPGLELGWENSSLNLLLVTLKWSQLRGKRDRRWRKTHSLKILFNPAKQWCLNVFFSPCIFQLHEPQLFFFFFCLQLIYVGFSVIYDWNDTKLSYCAAIVLPFITFWRCLRKRGQEKSFCIHGLTLEELFAFQIHVDS